MSFNKYHYRIKGTDYSIFSPSSPAPIATIEVMSAAAFVTAEVFAFTIWGTIEAIPFAVFIDELTIFKLEWAGGTQITRHAAWKKNYISKLNQRFGKTNVATK